MKNCAEKELAKAAMEAVQALARGEVVVFPTETFYGLGADALNAAAVDRVVSIKGRSGESPIAVIVADKSMVGCLVDEIPPMALRLMERFWPGPLTLVLRAKNGLPEPLVNRDGGVGVRVSSHRVAAGLAQRLGRPLTATSANPSGKEPARSVEEARSYFTSGVQIFIDGGKLSGTKGSTVADVSGGYLKIIREGEIDPGELERTLAAVG